MGDNSDKVSITIDLDPITGELNVVGPLGNLTLFLGMLEMAKMIAIDQRRSKEIPRILPVSNLNLTGAH